MAFRQRFNCFVCNESFRHFQTVIFRENADLRRIGIKRRNELQFPDENLTDNVTRFCMYCLRSINQEIEMYQADPDPTVLNVLFTHFNKCIVCHEEIQNRLTLEARVQSTNILAMIFWSLLRMFCQTLYKILSFARYNLKCSVFNTIKWILLSLGKSDIFRENIINGICHNLKCAMSYCAANGEFKDYVFTKTMILEYLLWTLRDIVYDAATSKVLLGNVSDNVPVARIRLVLESLDEYVVDKLPSSIRKFIDDILGL